MQYKFAVLLAFLVPAIVGSPVTRAEDPDCDEEPTTTPATTPTATPAASSGNLCGSSGNKAVFCNGNTGGSCTTENSGNPGQVWCCNSQAQQSGEWNINSGYCNDITVNYYYGGAGTTTNAPGGLVGSTLGGLGGVLGNLGSGLDGILGTKNL